MSEHKPVPELIEMFHRYQCRICKVWVSYDERNGKWWHYPYRSQRGVVGDNTFA